MISSAENYGNAGYAISQERYVLSDCLLKYGYRELAKDVQCSNIKQERLSNYLTIITREAQSRQDNDVLDRLYFSGLIYG